MLILGLKIVRQLILAIGLEDRLKLVSALQAVVSIDFNLLDLSMTWYNAGTSFRIKASIILLARTILVSLGRQES
jgi:hypothetical protein